MPWKIFTNNILENSCKNNIKRGRCEVRTVTKTIYSYEDMKALEDMTHEEASDYLEAISTDMYFRESMMNSRKLTIMIMRFNVHSELRIGYLKETMRNDEF